MSFIYLANLTNLFGMPADYGPLWSLAVEEHYYIAWPAVVRKLSTRNVALASAAICVVVPSLRAVGFHYGYTVGLGWYTWFVADGLAMGSLLAVVLRSSLSRARVARLCALLFMPALIFTGVGPVRHPDHAANSRRRTAIQRHPYFLCRGSPSFSIAAGAFPETERPLRPP